jgi:DNA-nicking Smr family endonuclease
VDLHHLHVDEALQRVRCVVNLAFRWGWPELCIVCGKGNHSNSGQSPVLRNVEMFLQRTKGALIANYSMKATGGSFLVKMKGRNGGRGGSAAGPKRA